MKRLLHNKKAVSPVIATVLMIMVTMVGMTILFAFVASYSDNYKAGIGSSVMESLVIEDIWLSPGATNYGSSVEISVYNAGKIDSTITSMYANGLKLTKGGNFNLNEAVPVGEHRIISLDFDNGQSRWYSGREYEFQVSTLRGSDFKITYTAP